MLAALNSTSCWVVIVTVFSPSRALFDFFLHVNEILLLIPTPSILAKGLNKLMAQNRSLTDTCNFKQTRGCDGFAWEFAMFHFVYLWH